MCPPAGSGGVTHPPRALPGERARALPPRYRRPRDGPRPGSAGPRRPPGHQQGGDFNVKWRHPPPPRPSHRSTGGGGGGKTGRRVSPSPVPPPRPPHFPQHRGRGERVWGSHLPPGGEVGARRPPRSGARRGAAALTKGRLGRRGARSGAGRAAPTT